MQEFEQQFIMGFCKVCSTTEGRYGMYQSLRRGNHIQERKFVTMAGDDTFAVCSNCGFKIPTKDIKEIQNG